MAHPQLQGAREFHQHQLALPRSKKPLPPAIPFLTHDRYEYDPATCTLKKKEGECTNQLHLVSDALELIRSIDKPVAVLSICGPHRSGKSYFLSRMLGDDEVFKLGHTQHACTRGIWMATTALECDEFVLLLLDTEGTNSAAATESAQSADVLVMSTLLSSLLIYNSQGVPCKSDLESMSHFAHLSSCILTGSGEEPDNVSLRKHFPDCLWLLCDIGVTFEDDTGNEISATQYLSTQVLVRSKETTATTSDHVVRALLELFPSLEARAIAMPSPDRNVLKRIIETKDQLFAGFNIEVEEAIHHILQSINPKEGFTGALVNGSTLASLAEQYHDSINTPGAVPNLELSWVTAMVQNLKNHVTKLVKDYEQEMEAAVRGKLPLEKDDSQGDRGQTLMGIHDSIMKPKKESLEDKIKHDLPSESIAQYKELLSTTFDQEVSKVFSRFSDENHRVSRLKCEEVFRQLYQPVEEKLDSPDYTYIDFLEDIDQLKMDYDTHDHSIGPAKEEVLQKKQHEIIRTIRETDFIPGPPLNVRVAGRAHNRIKIRWNPPDTNAKAAECYKVEVKYGKSKEVKETIEVSKDKMYVVVCGLDSNTNYYFCVWAENRREKKGEYSNELKTSTKHNAWCGSLPGLVDAGAVDFVAADIGSEVTSSITHPAISTRRGVAGSIAADIGSAVTSSITRAAITRRGVATTAGGVLLASGTAYAAIKLGENLYLSDEDIDSD